MSGVRGRRWLVILAILAGLVGLYAAVGFLLIPRLVRSEMVGLAARDFGRTLTVGDVRFNPFTWTLDISDVSFPDADGRPLISFGRLQVSIGISSVPRLAPSLSDIVLDSPQVNAVVRRDGKPFGADPRAGPWASVIRRDAEFAAAYAAQDMQAYVRICENMRDALFDRDTAPGAEPADLKRTEIPALIVPGNDDSHATSAAQYLDACLPLSEYWDMPVEGQTEAATNARILEFLAKITGEAASAE